MNYCPCLLDESFPSEHGVVLCRLPKLPFPPHLLSSCLKIKSAGIQYFCNLWDLLLGEAGRWEGGCRAAAASGFMPLDFFPWSFCRWVDLNKPAQPCKLFPGRKSVCPALYSRHERCWGQGGWVRLPEDCWGHRLSGKHAASLVLAFLCFRVQRPKTHGIPNFLVL